MKSSIASTVGEAGNKVICFYEKTHVYRKQDEKYWAALCRTFDVSLQMIDKVTEAVLFKDTPIICVEENRSASLPEEFEYPEKGIYIFGSVEFPKPSEVFETNLIIYIPVPKLESYLYAALAGSIVLYNRAQYIKRGLA